jgi:tetratricopeptide (TPR) repeat protein
VVDAQGHPVADASVSLYKKNGDLVANTKTDAVGQFSFVASSQAGYRVLAEQADSKSETVVSSRSDAVTLTLDLKQALANPGSGMEFSDQPHFAVAGVTDWTAAGGHGSDTILRASESLTEATLALKESSHGYGDLAKEREALGAALKEGKDADTFRLAGSLDERLGNPLLAVEEFERAAALNPSEQNEFEWASDLLHHRAVAQAEEVFRKGVDAYPTSLRMKTGLAAALFAGSRYQEAAFQLCKVSDLDPAATGPYISLGEIEVASPSTLSCVETTLERFIRLHPENATANYLYAVTLMKGHSKESAALASAKRYLNRSVSLDPAYGEAYLRLGVLATMQNDYRAAIQLYIQAIQVEHDLADAYYRLGVAYDRVGDRAKAQEQFALHQAIKEKQAAAIDEQRKTVKQFLFAKPDGQPVTPGR